MANVIAQVFEVSVSDEDWETHLAAVCWPSENWQQTMRIVCRQPDSGETAVELETLVSSVPDEEEDETTSPLPRLMHDPPAAVFDRAIRNLDAVAGEVMRGVGGQRGRLQKVFESAKFELQLPLSRREAVEALRGPFEKLPAYEGEVGVTSDLRLKDIEVGAGALSLWASVHQEPDDPAVGVHLQTHLRSADERRDVERRLDHVVELLEAAAPTA